MLDVVLVVMGGEFVFCLGVFGSRCVLIVLGKV